MTKADKEGQRKAPILRFKGFTDDWEQRQLQNQVQFFSGLTYSPSDVKDVGTFVIRSSNIKDNTLISADNVYVNPNIANSEPVKKDDVIMVVRNGSKSLIGKHALVTRKIDNTVIGAFMTGIRSSTPYFLDVLLDTINFKKEIYKNLGATINQITIGNLRKMTFKVPNESEKFKIGNLFKKLNYLLALYERKTRLLSKLRTFLTQRLFSNSSKVSLYFDNKNWSKHKISEFLTERNEKVIPNPSIPLVSFTVEKGVTPKSKRYNREFLVKDDKKKYKITKKNDIVYNPANLKFGAIARNKFGNAAFSPIYVTFITKLNPVFTEFLVRRKDFIKLALKYQEGTVYERMAVKSKDFLSLKIYLPNSSRDINHIAQILQSLDTLVSLNKNKISLITLIKKELLNTMFI